MNNVVIYSIFFARVLICNTIGQKDPEKLFEFDKFQQIFETFAKSCTIHFIWSPEPNNLPEPQTSFTQYCFKHSTSLCATFHFHHFHHSENMSISVTYTPKAIISRFRHVCTVELPLVINYFPSNRNPYFEHKELFQNSKLFTESGRLYSPDFVILPMSLSKFPGYMLTILMWPYLSSKVILLNIDQADVYTSCVACMENFAYNWYTLTDGMERKMKVGHVPVVKIISNFSANLSVKQIEKIWDNLNFKVGSAHGNEWERNDELVENGECGYQAVSKKVVEIQTIDKLQACILFLVKESLNCTSDSCLGLLGIRFQFGNLPNPAYIPLSYGAQFHGIRFSVFIDKRKELEASLNVVSIMYPITLWGWVAIFCSFFWIGSALKASTKLSYGVWFWLFCTFLEQLDDLRSFRNYRNWFLLLIWLFAALMFRNVYTSSMFTYLTLQPSPKNIPGNFYALTVETGSVNQFLGNHETRLGLSEFHSAINKSKMLEFSGDRYMNKLKVLDNGFWAFAHTYRAIYSYLRKGDSGELKDFCHKSNIIRYSKGRDGHAKSKCMDWSRFALLFSTEILEMNLLRHNTLLTKLLLALFGPYSVYENNENPVFSSVWVWYSTNRNFLVGKFEINLAYLVESGIVAVQQYYFEMLAQWTIVEEFRREHQIPGWGWNMLSLVSFICSRSPLGWFSGLDRVVQDLKLSQVYQSSSDAGGVSLQDVAVCWVILIGMNVVGGVVFVKEFCSSK